MQNVKIPQNVKVEDKLIGPFSIKQLILVGIRGGFSYTLFATIQKSVGMVPAAAHAVIWWPGILSFAFALVRINDISLFRYCLLILETLSKPRKRIFQARQGLIINIQTRAALDRDEKVKAKAKAKADLLPTEAAKPPIRLEDLSTILDAEGKRKEFALSVDPLETPVDSVRSSISV